MKTLYGYVLRINGAEGFSDGYESHDDALAAAESHKDALLARGDNAEVVKIFEYLL